MGLENLAISNFEQLGTQLAGSIQTLIQQHPYVFAMLIFAAIWEVVWYCIALYMAGSRKQKLWFIILILCFGILNDIGMIAIIYIIYSAYTERKNKNTKTSKKK